MKIVLQCFSICLFLTISGGLIDGFREGMFGNADIGTAHILLGLATYHYFFNRKNE